MEVETAVRRMLLTVPTVTGYVQDKVWKFRLEERDKVEGKGSRAIVVSRNNGWATPDPVRSAEFPILRLRLYADPDRDDNGEITTYNAEEKAWAMYRAVDPLFHNKRGVRWGGTESTAGLYVVTSKRHGEPSSTTAHEQHGHPSEDPLGDMAYVEVQYALQVIH